MTWRIVLAVLGIVVLLPVVGLAVLSWTSRPPAQVGAVDGKLARCPSSPNCVCSCDSDPRHAIEPLSGEGDARGTLDRIASLLEGWPRCRIVAREGDYLRAEFTSAVYRFVDDVEFLADQDQGVVHVRSASRAGHSDLGVNRRRVEAIRAKLGTN